MAFSPVSGFSITSPACTQRTYSATVLKARAHAPGDDEGVAIREQTQPASISLTPFG
jgi:hypothetical protein